MAKARHQLRQRVAKAYNGVAERLARKAWAACERFDTEDGDALHDFRVTVRRLRTHLATLSGQFGGERAKRLRKQLSDLVVATNTSRDYEIQRRWLEHQLHSGRISPLQREGLQLILNEIRPAGEGQAELEPIKQGFAKLDKKLRKRHWSVRAGGKRMSDDSVAAATRAALRKHSAKLRTQLAEMQSVDSVEATHRARLATKRLRYILEPLAAAVPGVREVLSELKAMQERLGELRDRQILAKRVPGAAQTAATLEHYPVEETGGGDAPTATTTAPRLALHTHARKALEAGLDHVRREASYHFAVVQDRWLGDNAARLLGRIEDIAAAL
jgi:CHAD domain-containing protein